MKKKASDKLYQMGIKGEYFCTKTLNGFESYFNGPFVFFPCKQWWSQCFCGPEFHLQCLPIELIFGSLTDTYICRAASALACLPAYSLIRETQYVELSSEPTRITTSLNR